MVGNAEVENCSPRMFLSCVNCQTRHCFAHKVTIVSIVTEQRKRKCFGPFGYNFVIPKVSWGLTTKKRQ